MKVRTVFHRAVGSLLLAVVAAWVLLSLDRDKFHGFDAGIQRRISVKEETPVDPRIAADADQACPARELPAPRKAFFPPTPKVKKFVYSGTGDRRMAKKDYNTKTSAARAEGCIRYRCSKHTEPHCQDHFAATDYTGDHPPCCQHVLRDMLRETDAALCDLGVAHTLAYGGLLGLVRDDRVLPWTADNDYVVGFAAAAEIWRRREGLRADRGLYFFNHLYFRACAAENFRGGALRRWETRSGTRGRYEEYLPYADFFVGGVDPASGMFVDERGCAYAVSSRSPHSPATTRLRVYNQTFSVNVPQDFTWVLKESYGPGWTSPPENPTHHGVNGCPQSKFLRRGGLTNDRRWENFWNDRLEQPAKAMPSLM